MLRNYSNLNNNRPELKSQPCTKHFIHTFILILRKRFTGGFSAPSYSGNRLREVKKHAPSHTAGEWQSYRHQESNTLLYEVSPQAEEPRPRASRDFREGETSQRNRGEAEAALRGRRKERWALQAGAPTP